MPLRTTSVATAGTQYATQGLFVGPVDHTHSLLVDLSDLTYADESGGEVDADGYLIPGTPLKKDGTLADGTTDEFIFGVVVEPVNVGVGFVDADTDLDALTDIHVAVATVGQVNRDIVEDNLGRALSANEIAAFDAAGSKLVLLPT